MKQILVLSGNELERRITGEILSSRCEGAKVWLSATAEEALERLESGEIDLFVADVFRFDLAVCNLMTTARKLAPDTPILVTSAGDQDHISGYVWRLCIRDYLLKPCRPAWLVAAAKALIREEREVEKKVEGGKNHKSEYLNQMLEDLRGFKYKKCIQTAKEYLDLLHQNTDNIEEIRKEAVSFAEGVAELGAPFGQTVQWKLESCLEHFRIRFDRQERKYDTYLTLEKMLDIIFDAMEESKFYEVGMDRKILNYIDRNLKRGLSLDDAAEYANMSSCYFSKVFKKMTGQNYITYVTDGKIEAAKQMLLDTDMPVINISFELSYGETNYFSKAFKKKVGVTPTEYREHYGKHRR